MESIVIRQMPSHPHLNKTRYFKFLNKIKKAPNKTKCKMHQLMKRKSSKEALSPPTCLQSGTESKIWSNNKITRIK